MLAIWISIVIWLSSTTIVLCWSAPLAANNRILLFAKKTTKSTTGLTAEFMSTATTTYNSSTSNCTEMMGGKFATRWVAGPDSATKPDYDNIHGPLGSVMDGLFLQVFRGKLAQNFGFDSNLPQAVYLGLVELAQAMNSRYSNRTQVQQIAQATLRSLFPSWLPGQFAVLFSKPFPEFSSRLNAWATKVGGTWLMGECEVNDVVTEDGTVLPNQGLLVKRCRFLEESGCASICVNSCKIPTQNFFLEDMGLPLTMTPDYETYECQFAFGVVPNAQNEFAAKNTPCLSRCPTAGAMRKWHSGEQTDVYSSQGGNFCPSMECGE